MEQLKQTIDEGENKADSNEKLLLIFLVVLVSVFLFIDKTKNDITPIDLSKIEEIKTINATDAGGTELVAFNTNSGKFHELNCPWAKKCKHCIKILKSDAIKRGGKPCKACGI